MTYREPCAPRRSLPGSAPTPQPRPDMSVLSTMKGVQARDQQMIREAETMFGPEPDTMGFIKNLFWGRVREDLVFPYPEVSEDEKAKTEALLAELNAYLDTEHPSVMIDQEQFIPEWAIKRLFDMGVMGMTVPEQYGGLGLGVAQLQPRPRGHRPPLRLDGRDGLGAPVDRLQGPDALRHRRSEGRSSCRRSPASTSRASASRSRRSARTRPARRPLAPSTLRRASTSSTARKSGSRRARSRACSRS